MSNNIYNNLSDDELKVSYWYVTHRVLLRKLGIAVLGLIGLGLVLYGAWGLINFYGIANTQSDEIAGAVGQDKLNYDLLAEANKPRDLVVLDTQVISSGDGLIDAVSQIQNPNLQWYVESFDYYYLFGETQTETQSSFILPGQTKFALQLGTETLPGNPNLVVDNIKWQKVSDYESLAEKMLQFEIRSAKITSSKQTGISDKESIATVDFEVVNKSFYNYWDPVFVVLVYRGDSVIAATKTTLKGINTGEVKTESINLFQAIPSGAQLQIVPDINILDPSVFKGFSNTSGEKK
jgi:hypothetical protein